MVRQKHERLDREIGRQYYRQTDKMRGRKRTPPNLDGKEKREKEEKTIKKVKMGR